MRRAALTCEECGRTVYVKPHLVADGQRFCSRACFGRVLSRRRGAATAAWKGGRFVRDDGRAMVLHQGQYVLEYRVIVERALGKALRPTAIVHHVDENPANNAPGNLVACEDDAYHKLLHVRARILRAGGKPALHKICTRCRALLPRARFSRSAAEGDGLQGACKPCQARHHRARKVA